MWIVCGISLLVSLLVIVWILPPGVSKPKQFLDEEGNKLQGSISEKIWIDINGTKLGVFIEARDETRPVLLILGGGPGIPEYLLEYMYPTKLSDEFVVCYVDYRGTGLSYRKDTTYEEMTEAQCLSDAEEVTKYLRKRFDKDKIYLMGHSFGSSKGLLLAAQHPEYYYAYIAMSQVVDQRRSEEMAYDYMYEQYKVAGNKKRMKQFEACPIKESKEAYDRYFGSNLRDFAMHELGVGTTRDMDSVITGILLPSLRCKAYTPMERLNIWRGKAFAGKTQLANRATGFQAYERVQELAIPIYFMAGKYDYTCCYDLQREYYEKIKAPEKKFYTFDNSAHSPIFEENEKAMKLLEEIVEKQ